MGNHFIEVNENSKGELFLVVHTGSRSLGTTVAEHHQEIARNNFLPKKLTKEEINAVEPSKRAGFIANHKSDITNLPEKNLEYLNIEDQVNAYLNDMKIAQNYAKINRETIITNIINAFHKLNSESVLPKIKITHTVHNYIDIDNKIIRKGAIFADPNNDIIIPLNMRDGSIIARGIGNKDANYSAPHGAGRIMSRNVAKETIKMEDFVESMKNVKSWTINQATIDEAPFAYKTKEFILANLHGLVEVKEIIKPIFNFKDDTSGNSRGRK